MFEVPYGGRKLNLDRLLSGQVSDQYTVKKKKKEGKLPLKYLKKDEPKSILWKKLK